MLQINSIEIVYDGIIRAVQDLSLQIPDRAIVALLGANGAGKSTVLKAISGLLGMQRGKLVKGNIYLDGERIDRLDPGQIVRRGLVQVMEGRRIFFSLTVAENLQTGGYSRRSKKEKSLALEQVLVYFPVLKQRLKMQAGYLSGGEQQMLAMGRALMAAPRILLLDEPGLGLAPAMVSQIGDIIREINAAGTAVLLVEQNAAMALSVAGYGYVMESGRIALEGSSEQLKSSDLVKRLYLGQSESGVRLDYSRLKDKEQRQARLAARKCQA